MNKKEDNRGLQKIYSQIVFSGNRIEVTTEVDQ